MTGEDVRNTCPIVQVTWLDPAGKSGWTDLEGLAEAKPVTCTTVGWLITDTPDNIVVVASLGASDGADSTTIPRACVVAIDMIVEALAVNAARA